MQQQLLLSLAGAVLALAAACPQPAQAASFGSRPPYRPGPEARAPAGKSVGQRAVEVIGLSAEAQAASDGGDYAKVPHARVPAALMGGSPLPSQTSSVPGQALEAYQTIVRDYSDLALSQKAHVGLALVLYQQGQHAEALAELKSVEFRLRGNPEVCCARSAAPACLLLGPLHSRLKRGRCAAACGAGGHAVQPATAGAQPGGGAVRGGVRVRAALQRPEHLGALGGAGAALAAGRRGGAAALPEHELAGWRTVCWPGRAQVTSGCCACCCTSLLSGTPGDCQSARARPGGPAV